MIRLIAAVLVATLAGHAHAPAQTPTKLCFEVASIKPLDVHGRADGLRLGDMRPTLFRAREEQLGLKLVAARGDVLIVDHIERPAVN